MVVKVCGMREADNIRAISKLGVDMLGFVFCLGSPRFVPMISSRAGIIPDYGTVDYTPTLSTKTESEEKALSESLPLRVGVFADDMPQNIVTRVYNYQLDYVQLNGSESKVMIDNLRRTLEPDIRMGVKIIKTIYVDSEDDVRQACDYADVADMILFQPKGSSVDEVADGFDWSLLNAYDAGKPFLIGSITPDDVQCVRDFQHPQFAGVSLDVCFDDAPGIKNVEKIKSFLEALK